MCVESQREKCKKATMEQLAQFVTKSFEFNNNRVLELLSVATKVDEIDEEKSKVNNDNDNERNNLVSEDEESVEIDITNPMSPMPVLLPPPAPPEPLMLVKQKPTPAAKPKNWLISDNELATQNTKTLDVDENQKPQSFLNALNLTRTDKVDMQFRPKPVTELLKEIRKFQNTTPPPTVVQSAPLSTRLDDNSSRSSSPCEGKW